MQEAERIRWWSLCRTHDTARYAVLREARLALVGSPGALCIACYRSALASRSLQDRRVEASRLQQVVLKMGPVSRTTGFALVRSEPGSDGEVRLALHLIHLIHLEHRSQLVHAHLRQRAGYRWRRRSANLRHRPPCIAHRRRPKSWLPSRSAVGSATC